MFRIQNTQSPVFHLIRIWAPKKILEARNKRESKGTPTRMSRLKEARPVSRLCGVM
jgi:hypothetical protein